MNVQPLRPEFASRRRLAAKLEPFDSYWQAPKDIDSGYSSFAAYYRANYLPHLPADKSARILVVSCGPGYLLNVLANCGYQSVVGIDSDPAKVEHGRKRGLPCEVAEAFPYLTGKRGEHLLGQHRREDRREPPRVRQSERPRRLRSGRTCRVGR